MRNFEVAQKSVKLTHDSNHMSHNVKTGNADEDVTTASINIQRQASE